MNERLTNEKLLEFFPEFEKEFDDYVSWQDGINTGAFLTYEDLLLPHIEKAVENEDMSFLSRAADFIENIFMSEDEYAKNVLYVGILEGMKASCDHDKVRNFLHSNSLKAFDELVY